MNSRNMKVRRMTDSQRERERGTARKECGGQRGGGDRASPCTCPRHCFRTLDLRTATQQYSEHCRSVIWGVGCAMHPTHKRTEKRNRGSFGFCLTLLSRGAFVLTQMAATQSRFQPLCGALLKGFPSQAVLEVQHAPNRRIIKEFDSVVGTDCSAGDGLVRLSFMVL